MTRYAKQIPPKLEKGNYRLFRRLLDELDVPEDEIRNLGTMFAHRFSKSVAAEIKRYKREKQTKVG
ncbi:hypothetical protein SAMN00808754_1427 [Thermanaeromonas toyohensis ToBE]|uniref:Uncharacterized protein n=1 Tax=Thermanaeromonas toyohensis ToBE TaxID=698762 RepID=A0A1W1VSZ1_9FIRM|nr:hypothetical protein [Thermanaeromonas toyohensis]SMB96221.1 hypothetical protein SAMN00808754_1427 [Thermanaeromonas toyohensis ToBE]